MEIAAAMHSQVDWASAETPISEVARMMQVDDIGAVPVGKDDKLIGMVTDRDIALRVVAAGRDPGKTTAEEVISVTMADSAH